MTDVIEGAPLRSAERANRKRPTSVVTGPRRTPIEKLELIYALVTGPSKVTPSLLRIKILAICEGRTMPRDRKSFVILARRAGVSQAKCYTAWQEWCQELPAQPPDEPAPAPCISLPENDESVSDDVQIQTALYRYYDGADLLLYVGISGKLRSRTGNHIKGSSWMEFAVRSTIARYPTRSDAEEAEIGAIDAEHPIFNKQHNDTPGARRRVVEYLIEHDRLDLLAPAVSRG